ncbi:terminase small subunit [Paracoccus sp. Z330]|uniref:Terminase small subunit n=1 Tax=Paracoccus onchidii TaxID=3017813 RepID=A0ABT4ZI07_9RHOB|nr:terminase small subunit [Paracoccus onchidii]MDB6178990.1 terminase small subunit [Paracoccus onchidii]
MAKTTPKQTDFSKPLDDDRREAFCHAYLQTYELRESAVRAGYSEKAAKVTGCNIYKRPDVQGRIAYLKEQLTERINIQSDDVLREWVHMATANISDVMDWGMEPATDDDGNPILFNGVQVERPFVTIKDSKKLARHIKAGIAEITLTDKGSFKVKMHDKNKPLESMARYLGMFKEDNEQAGAAAAGTVAALIASVQGTPLPISTRQEDDDEE